RSTTGGGTYGRTVGCPTCGGTFRGQGRCSRTGRQVVWRYSEVAAGATTQSTSSGLLERRLAKANSLRNSGTHLGYFGVPLAVSRDPRSLRITSSIRGWKGLGT